MYLTTPHNTLYHFQAGKHVLCEKVHAPAGLLEAENLLVRAVFSSWMPALFCICHLYKELVRRVEAGSEGLQFSPSLIQENFGSYKEFDMENRFFNPKLLGDSYF